MASEMIEKRQNKNRDVQRALVKVDDNICVSLQKIPISRNYELLCSLLKNTKKDSHRKKRMLSAIIHILELLMIPKDLHENMLSPETFLDVLYGRNDIVHSVGIVDFEMAYNDFLDLTELKFSREDEGRTYFKDVLLHHEHGINCILLKKNGAWSYIVTNSNHVDVLKLLEIPNSDNKPIIEDIDNDSMSQILNSMNTEYDRNVARGLLSKFLPKTLLCTLGIDFQKAQVAFDMVNKSVLAINQIRNEIVENVSSKLDDKCNILKEKIKELENKDLSHLSDKRKIDLNNEIEILKEKYEDQQKIKERSSKYDLQRFNQMVEYSVKKKVSADRIGKRQLGGGAPSLLDSEDEEFVAAAIESKSSYHGRRQDAVMYTNHRIKESHLLSIANYNLFKRGKRLIKSSKTVLLRARPHNKKTIQGRKHVGKWLFCTKKPPKSELEKNESIHYQRAFVKNVRLDMYGERKKEYSLDISMDDKAYLRPGTDVGFRTTTSGRIFTLSEEERQRKLPQHDFPISEMSITPSSFRVMTWKRENVGGKELLVKVLDNSFVEIRPKYFIPSSGSVWASSLLKLMYSYPSNFILNSNSNSKDYNTFLMKTHDVLYYFILCTTNEDLQSLNSGEKAFIEYERSRLVHFVEQIFSIRGVWQTSKDIDALERTASLQLFLNLSELMDECKSLINSLDYPVDNGNDFNYLPIIELCKSILASDVLKERPCIKPFIAEYTDAGPGVGVSNHQVRFRFAELCLIQQSESRIRLHRAPGDSGQNESERTNAYIGDALVDGAAINWQHFDAFHGLEEEQVINMEYDDFQHHLQKVTEKNAWATAEEVSQRIDDEPGPSSGFLKSFLCDRNEEHFFTNTSFLHNYLQASEGMKPQLPGHGYFSKIMTFISAHCRIGKYFIDYQRLRCDSEVCEFCPARKFDIFPKFKQPLPDYSLLPQFHYQNVDMLENDSVIDQFQPKVQLKALFSSGCISSSDPVSVSNFSRHYIVPEEVVVESVRALELKKLLKDKRKEKDKLLKSLEKNKSFEDYDWENLVVNSELHKLSITVLNKYLGNFSLSKARSKKDKISAIIKHFTSVTGTAQNSVVEDEDNSGDDHRDDHVLAAFDSSDEDDIDENDEAEVIPFDRPTRSGRVSIRRF